MAKAQDSMMTIDVTGVRYTSSEFNDVLGSSDTLVLQYRALRVAGTSPALYVKLEGSNNGVDWVFLETLVNGTGLNTGTLNTGFGSSTVKIPAFVRLAVSMTGTSPAAEIQLIVCGRDAA